MTAPTAGAVATAATLTTLDAAYREALARTSAGVLRIMLASWRQVNLDDLADTSAPWLDDSIAAVLAGRRAAEGLANAYMTRVRNLTVPDAPSFTPPPAEPPSVEQIRNSLEFTGIKQTVWEYAKQQTFAEEQRFRDDDGVETRPAAVPKQKILEDGIVRASGAAIRHVTTAGFDQIKKNVQEDRVAIGWYRTTKAGCCYFCAMLASRALVYKEDSFKASNAKFKGPGEQKVHDRCGCGLRPVYTASDDLPERTAEFEQMWIDHAEGYSGADAIYHFRLAYEGRVAPRSGR